MRTRSGQVALYLILAIAAVVMLAVMNAGVFLSIRAKNRAMNAGDAAALAVARHQGELLNRIGRLNLEHLKAMVEKSMQPGLEDGEAEKRVDEGRANGERCFNEQRQLCFLGPLDGIAIGNEAAANNGVVDNPEMKELLQNHIDDIRSIYANNPEAYPEPWEGAWLVYADKLSSAISGGVFAGPDNIDFVDAQTGHFLLMKQFYNAVSGGNWCWFNFNAKGLLASYLGYRDWPPLPSAEDEVRRRRCENSEVYSLGLTSKVGSALALFGEEFIRSVLNVSDEDLQWSRLLKDEDQRWFFYDVSGGNARWCAWSSSEGGYSFSPAQFPIVGSVKEEFDVLGCAAICRVEVEVDSLLDSEDARTAVWAAAAKPFGSAMDERGRKTVVTAVAGGLVMPSFTDVRLVPVDAVGGADLSTADADWMHHIRDHLPRYLLQGPSTSSGCFYCRQLVTWERQKTRTDAENWLRNNSESCVRSSPGGNSWGGTVHGH